MQARLLVRRGQERGLAGAVGSEARGKIELEALSNVVLGLDGRLEHVVGSPTLGEDHTVSLVGVLGLKIAGDSLGLVVLLASNLEGDVGRSDGLDLKAVALEVVVPAQQVVGGLAEILRVANFSRTFAEIVRHDEHAPSRMGGRAGGGATWREVYT